MATPALNLRVSTEGSFAAFEGSQRAFLESPWDEVLYEGERGPGKTLSLLMDFAQNVGKGYGRYWRGILFREEATQLGDVISKTRQWFPGVFSDAKYLGGNQNKWVFADGEELLFRHMRVSDDYWKYHGHEYPWIGWEELTNWATPDCYLSMFSCSRSTGPDDMPRHVRATCNSYGRGHGWVKGRFIDPMPRGRPTTETMVHPLTGEKFTKTRCAIHGRLDENKALMAADPNYVANLLIQAGNDENKLKAWLEGSWDIVTGGIFDGSWSPDTQILDPFKIPASWYIDRAFDWGSSAPYSVGWFAESDGSEATLADGTKQYFPRGSVFHIAELYGWNGKPNQGVNHTTGQIAKAIQLVEPRVRDGLLNGQPINAGPCDPSFFNVINGECFADQMAQQGVTWTKGYKDPNSRVPGIEKLKQMFLATRDKPLEKPGFYVFNNCRQWLRTVPVLPRDNKNPDDADSDGEDHPFDMTRYRVMKKPLTGAGAVKLGRVR